MHISVIHGEVQSVGGDLLVLKNADNFYGADAVVAGLLGMSKPVAEGEVQILSSTGSLKVKQVAFIGVGPLERFGYEDITMFGSRAMGIVANASLVRGVHTLTMTSHGSGIGLDEAQAFNSLLVGLYEGRSRAVAAGNPVPERILIVESHVGRARLFQGILDETERDLDKLFGKATGTDEKTTSVSESSPKLFAAMPFDDKYSDEYQIAFLEAAHANGFLCERLDLATYVGDVLSEIKSRIEGSSGVIALMNDANANVFLEIGYAWAKGKPTLLVLKRGQKPPFDVQGHRYIEYGSIAELRQRLTSELTELKRQNVLR